MSKIVFYSITWRMECCSYPTAADGRLGQVCCGNHVQNLAIRLARKLDRMQLQYCMYVIIILNVITCNFFIWSQTKISKYCFKLKVGKGFYETHGESGRKTKN